MDLSATQSTGLSRIKPTLEFLGSTTILVVLMGLPATVHHYSSLQVPIALLSYRRVLEAGLFPATLIVLFLIYLFWAERKLTVHKKSILEGIDGILTRRQIAHSYLSLPAVPFILPAILFFITGFLAIYVWIIWGIGWVLTKPIMWVFDELTISDRWITVIGLSIVVILLLSIYLRNIIVHKRQVITNSGKDHKEIHSHDKSKENLNVAPRRHSRRRTNSSIDFYYKWVVAPKTLNEAILGSLLLYIILPPMIIMYAYLTKSGILLVSIPWPVSLSHDVLLIAGIFMGISYAHFLSAESFMKFIASQNEKTSEGAKIARRVTYTVFITACITLYSLYIYPNLPRSYGGGQPETLDVVTNTSIMSDHLSPLFTNNNSKNIYIDNIQLIDKTSDEVIFCKELQTTHFCLSVPVSSILSMSWQYGGTKEPGIDSE